MNKIYVLLILLCVGCSLPSSPESGNIDVVMVDRLHLTPLKTTRGVYSVRLDTNALQTFFKVRAQVDNKSYTQRKVYWYSNDYWLMYFVNGFEKVPIVNQASYVTDDGYAYNMAAVNIQLRNRIVTIYGYYYEHNTRYIDSIKVYVN